MILIPRFTRNQLGQKRHHQSQLHAVKEPLSEVVRFHLWRIIEARMLGNKSETVLPTRTARESACPSSCKKLRADSDP